MAEGTVVPHGPVQRRLLGLLAEEFPDLGFSTGVATRSTLGPDTLTVRPIGDAAEVERIAAWLDGQESVDVAAPKKGQLHVRLTAEALRTWFCEGWEQADRVAAGELGPVSLAVPAEESPCSLDLARKAVVARSLAALLEDQGHTVEVTASADEQVWLSDGDASAQPRRIDVAEVDAKHDRLRARHGGTLTLENLREDIREDAILLDGRERDDRYADTFVAYLMTQVPRERRLGIDDEKVGRKVTELDEILAAAALAKEKSAAPAGGESGLSSETEPVVRGLIGQIEPARDLVAYAAKSLDPAPLTRLIRSLAEEIGAAGALPAGDPLWAAAAEALENGLRLLAPDDDRGHVPGVD
ncbi:MAG TPA: hypothetical protein VFI17_07310 [Solirubrobacterales bacterium]|nr:hypothetical protein [Solirubrobacterales bacterium]